MKLKFLLLGLLIIVLSSIGNSIYFNAQQLDQPLFLEHYYVHQVGETPLKFYYIDNKFNQRKINYVTINGKTFHLQNNSFAFQHPNKPRNITEYSHHALREIFIYFNEPSVREIQLPFSFNDMTVHFNDGTSAKVDVGHVNVKKPSQFEKKPHIYTSRHYGSGSDGRAIESKQFHESAQIESLSIPLEEVKGDFEVKLNTAKGTTKQEWREEINKSKNHPIEPLMKAEWSELPGGLFQDAEPYKIEQGKQLYIYTQIDLDKTHMYLFRAQLNGTTDQGESFAIPLLLHEDPNLSSKDIQELIKARGE
ncbi:hypothetical protein [Piscibacillus salipiscarius]|uniref:Uncharacterized protein n=1 Tax=Piscibacillus salipiscarius TaxID=299480 RepID=A0ABW5QCH5_9BACI|nr:hypothetical protein [Piscibacillus salipiscarius]